MEEPEKNEDFEKRGDVTQSNFAPPRSSRTPSFAKPWIRRTVWIVGLSLLTIGSFYAAWLIAGEYL